MMMIFEDEDYDDAMGIAHGKTELIRTKQMKKNKTKSETKCLVMGTHKIN